MITDERLVELLAIEREAMRTPWSSDGFIDDDLIGNEGDFAAEVPMAWDRDFIIAARETFRDLVTEVIEHRRAAEHRRQMQLLEDLRIAPMATRIEKALGSTDPEPT